MIKGYEYQSDFAKRYVAEGRDRGRAEGRVEGHAEGLVEGLTQGHTEGLTEGLIKGLTEGLLTGLIKGRTEEAARNLLTVLRVRNLAVPDAARERILAQEDPERLERWLEKATVATSVAAVLDEPN
jgi:predicted transposase YdaD